MTDPISLDGVPAASLRLLGEDTLVRPAPLEERRRGEGDGARLYRKLKRLGYPKGDYQALCMNCQFSKHILGECAHKKARPST